MKSFKKILDLFLTKTPSNVNIEHLKEHLLKIDNVVDIHHIHIWSMDEVNNYATMHLVTKSQDIQKIKREVREELEEHGINHVTIEVEDENYRCDEIECEVKTNHNHSHHHHHH